MRKVFIYTVINIGIIFLIHLMIELLSGYYIDTEVFGLSAIVLSIVFLLIIYCAAALTRKKLLADFSDKRLFISIFFIVGLCYMIFWIGVITSIA